MGIHVTLNSLAVIVTLTVCAFAQEQPPVLQGTWTGTSGPKKVYRGGWSARVLSGTPNVAQGSWVLVNDANKIVLQGIWAAEKSPRGWHGTWSARIVPEKLSPRGSAGKVITGTWQASMKDSSIKSLVEMLLRTLKDDISGSWRSGPHQGNWWLKGTRDAPR